MRHLNDQHVLILGLGASGLAMARWCARHGAHVTVADTREAPPQLAALREAVPQARFVGGDFSAALVEGTPVRAVYRSPGLSPAAAAPVLDAARAIGLAIGGELDLFAHALADLRTPQVPAVAEEAGIADDVPPAEATDTPEAAPAAIDGEEAAPMAEDDDESEPPPVVVEPPPQPQGYAPAVLAVTGTNGKTTVTALTGQLVERAGKTVAVAGNIGPTLLDTLGAHMDADTLPEVWVLELSSFQLDGVQGFEPTAAAVLNLTQDHLDWHGSSVAGPPQGASAPPGGSEAREAASVGAAMAAYAAAKARIFGQQGLMVLNRDDPAVMQMLPPPVKVRLQRPQVRAHLTFGDGLPQRPSDFGIERVNGMAWLVRAHEADETQKRRRGAAAEEEEIHLQRLMPADALRIRGRHNALNALAALALASAAGCQLGPMLYGLREYRGEPHRVESIALIEDVEYFDDSKGTNVGATVAALGGLGAERKLIPILGGDGKGQDFTPLAAPVRQHARAVVLIGRDAPVIEAVLADTGVPLLHAASMAEAVALAARRAHAGDAVLLSPACASFDMFDDYVHRAAVFGECVQALADAPPSSEEAA